MLRLALLHRHPTPRAHLTLDRKIRQHAGRLKPERSSGDHPKPRPCTSRHRYTLVRAARQPAGERRSAHKSLGALPCCRVKQDGMQGPGRQRRSNSEQQQAREAARRENTRTPKTHAAPGTATQAPQAPRNTARGGRLLPASAYIFDGQCPRT